MSCPQGHADGNKYRCVKCEEGWEEADALELQKDKETSSEKFPGVGPSTKPNIGNLHNYTWPDGSSIYWNTQSDSFQITLGAPGASKALDKFNKDGMLKVLENTLEYFVHRIGAVSP